jgi:hypothetical protein
MRLIGFSNYPSKYQKKMLIRYGYGKFPMTVKEVKEMDINGHALIQGEHNKLPTNTVFFIIEEEQTQ